MKGKQSKSELLQMLAQNKSNSTQNYANLVDRENEIDPLAQAFSSLGSGEINGPQDRSANALFSGLGAGLKGASNKQKNSKLAELQEFEKQIAYQDAMLKTQLGETQARDASLLNFTSKYKPELMSLNRAIELGDEVSENKITSRLIQGASQYIPGFKEEVGNFTHSYGGNLYFERDGEMYGVPRKEFFSNLPLEDTFGEQAQTLNNLLSNVSLDELARTSLLKNLEVDQAQGKVRNDSLKGDLYNSQINKLNAETNSITNPEQKLSPDAQKYIVKKNIDRVTEIQEGLPKKQKYLLAYQRIYENLKANPDVAGSGFYKDFIRWKNAKAGTDKATALDQLYRNPLLTGLKDIFAGATSNLDVDIFLEGIPKLSDNRDAALLVAQQRIDQYKNEIQEGIDVIKRLSETNYSQLDLTKELTQGNTEQAQSAAGGMVDIVINGKNGQEVVVTVPANEVQEYQNDPDFIRVANPTSSR